MPKKVDLTGRTFGQLTVLRFSHIGDYQRRYWVCRCECGSDTTRVGSNLTSGNSVSCGCIRIKRASLLNRTHGKSGTLTYSTWLSMNARCNHPHGKNIRLYTGVKICERWHKFENFLADMGERPK